MFIRSEDEEIKEEMHMRKSNALKKLSKIISPTYVEQFSKTFLYSWKEGLVEAENIANELDFYPADFCALDENFEDFKGCYLTELSKMEIYA